MVYQILADGVMLAHFAWILFVGAGILIALKYPRVAWIHGGALLFTLILNIQGWHCPLTDLENHLGVMQGAPAPYRGSFLAHHLGPIIYPDLAEGILRRGVLLFVGLNLAGYMILWRRSCRESKKKPMAAQEEPNER
jgi:hypothetical protein